MADGSTFDLGADVVELTPYVPAPQPATPLREVAFRSNSWTPEEYDLLRRMFAADVGVHEMAEAIGRPFHAVRSKICDLGLRRNSARPWSELEDTEMVQRYGEVPTATLAQELGRSCSAVYARASVLGLMEDRPPPYTEWEDAQVRAGYAAGVPVAQIAALIGRPLLGVRSRALDHLRLTHANHPTGWTEAECTRALELVHEGKLYSAARAVLLAEGFPARSNSAFKVMMQKLAYGRGWGRRWGAEEDELLRKVYADGTSRTPLLQRLGRSAGSVNWRARELGLSGTHKNHDGFRQGPVWTEEEDELLRASFGRVRGKKLFALFEPYGRKKGAIYMRARGLGLDGGYNVEVTEDELRAIHIGFALGLGLRELAGAAGRDTAVTHRLAQRMGLNFSDPARPKASRTPRSKRPPPPTMAEILAMPADIPPGPYMTKVEGWRKRGRPPANPKETSHVA